MRLAVLLALGILFSLAFLQHGHLEEHAAKFDQPAAAWEEEAPPWKKKEGERPPWEADIHPANEEHDHGPRAVEPDSGPKYTQPVKLELRLDDKYLNQPAFANERSMFRQYGFNLARSNKLPLDRELPDVRSKQCKAVTYPKGMPKVSIIIIFYNEALSTLMRNVLSCLNRSPPELVGEVLLVDDNSTLPELEEHLQEHLTRLPSIVRYVKRNVHNGIVGARNRGAKEAKYPVIAFVDSHAEVFPGWLEPLLVRIHEDRKRVVVPQLRPINKNSLSVSGGDMWPPSKGSFNWRLTFTIVQADLSKDMIGTEPYISPVRSPIMPGGIFAMDREFFWDLGGYDPEIYYYGAEHVELSFKVWMCGGSMENVPCSHVGHIYRDFDRFAVDPLLEDKKIGPILDRNDMRVAEVWMDDYKRAFYDARGLHGKDFGDISDRLAIRERLQCHSFQWFLDNVHPDQFIPDLYPTNKGMLTGPDRKMCIDNMQRKTGPVGFYGCHGGTSQRWSIGKIGYWTNNVLCIHYTVLKFQPGAGTNFKRDGEFLRHRDRPSDCLAAVDAKLTMRPCDPNDATHKWTLSGTKLKQGSRCPVNNLRMGGCAGPTLELQGEQIVSQGKSLVIAPHEVGQFKCKDELEFRWKYHEGTMRPMAAQTFCLDRAGRGFNEEPAVNPCVEGSKTQQWQWLEKMPGH